MKVKSHHDRTTFTSATLNVKSNPEMSQAQVKHDVKKASHTADLIGWQEISPKRYLSAIRQLGPNWGTYAPHDGKLQIEDPISWKKSVWQKEDAGFIKTHDGKAKVSPNRYITWVKLKNRATGKDIVRINTHLVSGAFSHGQRPTTAWRQAMWSKHQQKLEALVDHYKKQGLDVVVGGDFNKDSSKVLGDHVQYDNNLHVGTHGKNTTYDYLMHAGKDLQTKNAHVVHGFASDHDEVVATYSLSGKGSPATQPSHPHATPPKSPAGPTHSGPTKSPAAPSDQSPLLVALEGLFKDLLQALGLS
jgi:hypothetical protein